MMQRIVSAAGRIIKVYKCRSKKRLQPLLRTDPTDEETGDVTTLNLQEVVRACDVLARTTRFQLAFQTLGEDWRELGSSLL